MDTLLAILSYPLLLLIASCRIILSFATLFVPSWFEKKKDLRGQKVLITGAGSGLGRELAVEFSKHETCLILVDINKQSLLETELLLDRRSAVFIYKCDVTDYRKVQEMAGKVKEDAGDVDILVNNAGIVVGKYLMDLPEEKIIKTFEVNALAHFWTCRSFLPAMISRNRGHVVGVVSGLGKVGSPQLTDYCASKFAALGFCESLEVELREQGVDGVKVTVVLPSFMNTGMFRGARLKFADVLNPEHVARKIVQGVCREEETICLPHYHKNIFLIKEIVPRWWIIKAAALSGLIKSMKNFRGREPTTTQ